MPSWSFLSNHGAVLVLVATQPRITATEIGSQLGITERPDYFRAGGSGVSGALQRGMGQSLRGKSITAPSRSLVLGI
jgi:hypothetical protein